MAAPAAVFLSYASQDAEPARRIAEALRAAGVEVWFDQNELVGGDAWDQKIRKQIKDCALFVPIISANTQARAEGYFRLEWKLAVDRSHLIADDANFLLPVVIDDTGEAAARVPDRFRDIQWVRLGAKDTPETLAARVAKLLGGAATAGDREESVPRDAKRPSRARQKLVWFKSTIVMGALAVGLAYFFRSAWQPPRFAESKPVSASASVPAPTPGTSPLSQARQHAARAQELFLGLEATREDFALAEDLLKQGVAMAPNDGEVWAAYAHLHLRYLARGWDITDERREAARVTTQRALRLDPGSFEARFAAGLPNDGTVKSAEESERALRALLQERPDDKRVLRALATVLRFLPNREAEMIQLLDRSAHLPGGDPLALYSKALVLWFGGRAKEAEGSIADSLAQQPFTGARLLEAHLAVTLNGDLDRGESIISRLPSAALLEDRGCYFAYMVYRFRNEPERALAVVQAYSRDWISDNWFRGPRSLLTGNALAQAGRPEAAAIEWRAALKVVDQRLAANPSDLTALGNRLLLLALLDEKAEAHRLLPAVRQMRQAAKANFAGSLWYAPACLAMGERAEALRVIGEALQARKVEWTYYSASILRHDPTWAPLRGDPEFTHLIAEAERVQQRDATASGTSSPVPTTLIIEDKSVAVLAFANLSDDKANEYFSDGISEELLNALARVSGLKVTARTSAFSFKGRNLPVADIARQLGVAYVVEGSVRRSGDKVRLTAQLIKAADGFQVWSDTFTRDLKDIFAVQEEVAAIIVRNLRIRLAPVAAAPARTVDPEAFALLARARALLNRGVTADSQRARDHLRAAVLRDPQFALGWAWLAMADWTGASTGWLPPDAGMKEAREAAERALELDPRLPEAHAALGLVVYSYDWEWARAAAAFARAAELAPSDGGVVALQARLATTLGRDDEAVRLGRRAVELDPVNGYAQWAYCMTLLQAGRLTELDAQAKQALETSTAVGDRFQLIALVLLGRNEEAWQLVQSSQESSWLRHSLVGLVAWANGRRAAADAALAKLKQDHPLTAAYQIAQMHAQRGEIDEAFRWLDTGYIQRDGGMVWLKHDPFLISLHDDPRWLVLLRRMNLADDPPTP